MIDGKVLEQQNFLTQGTSWWCDSEAMNELIGGHDHRVFVYEGE